MSRKTNPKILKVKMTGDWQSRGFYSKNLPQYLEEDLRLREILRKKLPPGIVEAIEIERNPTAIKVIIKTSRPALVIGRRGEQVERLQKGLRKILLNTQKKSNLKQDLKLEIIEVKDPWTSAVLCSQWIALQLEKRVPYRRAIKMAIRKIMASKGVKGAKVMVSGRLNGVEISRAEWLREGKLPRNYIRGIMDYGFSQAHCTYGVIGVKVWIYKGEKF